MYPNLYQFLKEVFGGDPPGFTRYINSFGFFVALAFLLSGLLLIRELKRKERQGLLIPKEETIRVGEKAGIWELLSHFLFGFLVGYKLIGALLAADGVNPQTFIFSSDGSWPGGLLFASLFAGLRWWEKHKQALPKPEERKVRVWPHERVGDIIVLGAIGGFLGAKVFDNLENWDRFMLDPIANLLAPSGLTFYGGLIVAAIAILTFAHRKGIGLLHLVDATAPILMIAYAVGRIGCQVSGDGDWGIFNTAYVLGSEGAIVATTDPSSFTRALEQNPAFTQYLVREYGHLDHIPRTHFAGPSFLPNWLFAYNYPNNVNEVGSPIPGCEGPFCNQLNPLVIPTPLYEIITCTALFLVLWGLRKRIHVPGQLFGLYLVLNGIERFFIEQVRVNNTYDLLGFHPTQAELIAVVLMISGALLWWRQGRKASTR
ncbi:MAG: prolipoprotein diacylglyceryl transferase [Bacteroidetes bacterium]|nr:prolipoprotein diacylglyceryl transferase [Bacteroidota bacterium]